MRHDDAAYLPPTPRKIRSAKEAGFFPRSVLFNRALCIIVTMASFAAFLPGIIQTLREIAYVSWRSTALVDAPFGAIYGLIGTLIARVCFLGLTAVMGIGLVYLLQQGWYFNWKFFAPKGCQWGFSHGKTAAIESLQEWVVFALTLFLSLYLFLRILRPLCQSSMLTIEAIPVFLMRSAGLILISLLGFAVLVGILDLWLNYGRYVRRLAMTPSEMKKEIKETEGDPLIKRETHARLRGKK